jgi:hypothetical protein
VSSASKILPEGVKVTVPAAAVPSVDVKLPVIVLVDTSSGYGIKSPKYSHSNTSERDKTKQVFAYSTRFSVLLLFIL